MIRLLLVDDNYQRVIGVQVCDDCGALIIDPGVGDHPDGYTLANRHLEWHHALNARIAGSTP